MPKHGCRAQLRISAIQSGCEGWGVTKGYATALKWIRAAALQGFAKAQHNLVVLNTEGKGVS